MKPGEPLKRHTELARGAAPLNRRTALARNLLANPSKRSQKPAKPTKAPDIPQAVRDVVAARSGGDCEARIKGVCQGRATEMHHRRRRNVKPAHTVPNLLHLCGSRGCHGWITREPAASRGLGWIVSVYSRPESTPVLIRGTYVLLSADGRYEAAS